MPSSVEEVFSALTTGAFDPDAYDQLVNAEFTIDNGNGRRFAKVTKRLKDKMVYLLALPVVIRYLIQGCMRSNI